MMKRVKNRIVAAGILTGTLVLAGCGGGNGPGPGGSHGSQAESTSVNIIAQAEYPQEPEYKDDDERWEARHSRKIPETFGAAYGSFVYKTAAEVLGDGADENIVYSPMGLYYALAMSAQGAEGETRQEILELLGYPESGTTRQESGTKESGGWESLAQDCQTAFQALYHVPNPANSKENEWGEMPGDALYNLRIANSLWADDALELRQEFADQAAQYFYSDVYQADLQAPHTAEAMAEWVKERTGGVIVPASGQIPDQELLSLRNTVYYYDEWIDRFKKDKTKEDVFTTADGTRVTCEFMNKEMDTHGFRRGGNYTSSHLSLKNGSVLFVLPDEGVDVRELAASPDALKEVLEGTSGESVGEVVWKLPKFSYGSSMELTGTLQKLGVREAFGTEADFAGISDQKPLGITSVSQDTHIGIDENGVEAAAFTEIDYSGAALPSGRAEMILDRPFLYAVRSQGQILFVGICGNPELRGQMKTGGSGDDHPEEPSGSGQPGNSHPGEPSGTGQPGNSHPGESSGTGYPEKGHPGSHGKEGAQVSAAVVEELLAARNPYIGNASADGTLVRLVHDYYGIEQGWTMELQTTYLPYGLTLHFDQEPDCIAMQKAAAVLMGLIDNCYSVSWDYPVDERGNRQHIYMPMSALHQYPDISIVRDGGWSGEELAEFLLLLEQIDRPFAGWAARSKTLEQAVAAAVLERNRYIYAQYGEVQGEGHKILEQEESDNTVTVYALTMYGSYQFQDGNLVKDGGTGVIPAVIQVEKEPDGSFIAVHYQNPEDGSGYVDSIHKLFPETLWDVCISPPEQVRQELKQQEQAYATAYLEFIGREAAVGDYGDFDHTILTEVGVPVEVSNALGDIRDFAPDDPARYAPYWLGNVERVEDGVRYIYEQVYDQEKKEIQFSRICYETGEVVGRTVYDGLTGKKKQAAGEFPGE